MGFDEDLNEARKIAVRETVNFLAEQKTVPMSREEAHSLTSIVGDCRVAGQCARVAPKSGDLLVKEFTEIAHRSGLSGRGTNGRTAGK